MIVSLAKTLFYVNTLLACYAAVERRAVGTPDIERYGPDNSEDTNEIEYARPSEGWRGQEARNRQSDCCAELSSRARTCSCQSGRQRELGVYSLSIISINDPAPVYLDDLFPLAEPIYRGECESMDKR